MKRRPAITASRCPRFPSKPECLERPLGRRAVLAMIKRRASAAGLPASTCCHTFRATGITAYLSNGGTLEHAQRIAGHASPKTTTNVTQFTSLRRVPPEVPLETLRKLVQYFPSPQEEHALSPSYEDTEARCDPERVKVFKDLQKMEGVGLVVPVGEEHMYYAAMNSTACKRRTAQKASAQRGASGPAQHLCSPTPSGLT